MSRADLVPGGGPVASDCYAEFDVQGADGSSNKISCTDGDPACDSDGQCQNTCTFKIKLCLNQANVSGCTAKSFKKPPKVAKGLVPVPAADGANPVCGDSANVAIALKVKGSKTPKPKKLKLKVMGLKVDGKPKTDKDTLVLTCLPRTGECPPQTTTTTTVSTTTTTTGICTNCLAFKTTIGTANCGGAGLTTAGAAPFSGEIDSDTACTTKLNTCGGGSGPCDLALGCLFFGGGNATTVPPGRIPDEATSLLRITSPGVLGPASGTGAKSCTAGAGPGKHCINGSTGTGGGACTLDADCANDCAGCNLSGSCALDANCYFGPPLPIPSPPPVTALTTCVMNVIQNDAGGTVDIATGASSVSLPLASRVFITGNSSSPCPKCVSGTCDTTWKTNTKFASPDSGGACEGSGVAQTSFECRPYLQGFQAPLAVDLTPLTTGSATKSADGSGNFCPDQANPGVFGVLGGCIKETGSPGGDLSDMQPHASILGSVFCIPSTGNAAVDGVADLPGPGAIGLNGVAQIQ